jgi:hypothetical protein
MSEMQDKLECQEPDFRSKFNCVFSEVTQGEVRFADRGWARTCIPYGLDMPEEFIRAIGGAIKMAGTNSEFDFTNIDVLEKNSIRLRLTWAPETFRELIVGDILLRSCTSVGFDNSCSWGAVFHDTEIGVFAAKQRIFDVFVDALGGHSVLLNALEDFRQQQKRFLSARFGKMLDECLRD